MHATINGNKKSLAVRMYPNEKDGYSYTFVEEYEEYNNWVNEEIVKGRLTVEKTETFKDVNYLLNSMLKSRKTRYGNILYEIYIKYYPDSDQKINIWKLWNNMEVKKGETYINQRRPWYKIRNSYITSNSYSILIQCKTCAYETNIDATSIPKECDRCNSK